MYDLNILKRAYSKRRNVTSSKYTVEIEIEHPAAAGFKRIFNINTPRGQTMIMSACIATSGLMAYLMYCIKEARLKKPAADAEKINDVQ